MIESTKKQRQLIGIGCTKLGIDRALKEEVLMKRYGKSHTTEISKAQADDFLSELRSRGFATMSNTTAKARRIRRPEKSRGPKAKNVVAIASAGQIDKINALSALIEWKYADGLSLWMKKRIGVDRVRTANDAWRVIEGLKKMFENAMTAKYGADWWVREWMDERVRTYVSEHCPEKYR